MTTSKTPDRPTGESGVSVPGASSAGNDFAGNDSAPASKRTSFIARPWFWILLMAVAWILPLVKSLGGTFPDPPAGFDREPESFTLPGIEGESVQLTDLAGYLVVVQSMDMSSTEQLESDFVTFRELRDRLRAMGSLMVHVLLVEGGDIESLKTFVTAKKARKPNNIFLLDENGATYSTLLASSGLPNATLLLLDRHGRLRGSYDSTPEDAQLFNRAVTLLGNWEGCDPELGEPVFH